MLYSEDNGRVGGLKYDGSKYVLLCPIYFTSCLTSRPSEDDFNPSDFEGEEVTPTPAPSGKKKYVLSRLI